MLAAQFFTLRSLNAPYVLTMWLRPTSLRHAPHYLYVRLSQRQVWVAYGLIKMSKKKYFPISFVLSVIAVTAYSLYCGKYYFFALLPLNYIGAACSSPNFNLADGCLVYVVISFFAILAIWYPINSSVFAATIFVTWLLSCIEKVIYIEFITKKSSNQSLKGSA